MHLAVPISVILVLAASMPAYAMPYGAPQTFPEIEQRSPAPLVGPWGLAMKELVEGDEVRSSVVLGPGQGTEHKPVLGRSSPNITYTTARATTSAISLTLELNERNFFNYIALPL